jgi:hypothetical protein
MMAGKTKFVDFLEHSLQERLLKIEELACLPGDGFGHFIDDLGFMGHSGRLLQVIPELGMN